MEDFSHPVVFGTKTGIAPLLPHQSVIEILVLINSYFTQKETGLKSLLKRKTG